VLVDQLPEHSLVDLIHWVFVIVLVLVFFLLLIIADDFIFLDLHLVVLSCCFAVVVAFYVHFLPFIDLVICVVLIAFA